jgi:hypothetical protein
MKVPGWPDGFDWMAEDLCATCETWHESGPLWWCSCPSCGDPATCPHPSVMGSSCDACGAKA